MLIPDWPAPPGVHALCTTRAGGVSAAPFDSLNLGDHVGDDPRAVAHNRRHLQAALQARTPQARAVFLQQVHASDCLELQPGMADGQRADACISARPALACTIMVADCLPVLIAHRSAPVVAAAHAGWRGLAGGGGEQGVLEVVLERFWALAQSQKARTAIKNIADDTLVWLGPCIGPEAFEVGAEVREAFCRADSAAEAHFQAQGDGAGDEKGHGKYRADLAALARQRLARLGVTAIYGNDSSAPWCTFGQPERFFSHRRDGAALGASGRMAACVWFDTAQPYSPSTWAT